MAVTKILCALALVAAACSDPTEMPAGDGGPDAPIDARPVDADPDAIDAPPLPIDAPTGCPAGGEPTLTGGPLPTGAWNGRWSCVGDCARPTASPLFATTRLEIAGSTLTWRGPAGAIQHVATPMGGCLVVAATESPCASAYAVCRSMISTTCGGSPCVFVQFASAYQADVNRWQVWEFRGLP